MRLFSKLAGGIAIAALAGNAALAADAIEAPPEPPATPQVQILPADNWSGIYTGVFGGYDWANADATGGADIDGWNGGVFAGVNRQNGVLVYGVEGDIGLSGADATVAGTTVDKGVFGSVRARAGYDANPFLIYGTAGVAAAKGKISAAAGSDSNIHYGWTAGAGVDTKLTDNVFGRVEYRYSDYGSKNYTIGGGTVSSGFTEHSVRAGIGMKF